MDSSPPLQVHLVVARGLRCGETISVLGPQFLIGRSKQCDLRPSSVNVEECHCGLFLRRRAVLLRDFQTAGGTFVNQRPIEGEVRLADGDELRVGPLTFMVRIETPVLPALESHELEATTTASDACAAEPEPAEVAQFVLDKYRADRQQRRCANADSGSPWRARIPWALLTRLAGTGAGLVVLLGIGYLCWPLLRSPARAPLVYRNSREGIQLSAPMGWSEIGRDSPAGPERLLIHFKRKKADSPAWLRVTAASLPVARSLESCLAERSPDPTWKPEGAVEGITIHGLPAARATFRGQLGKRQFVSEMVALRSGDRVFFLTGTVPAQDASARQQVRAVLANAVVGDLD